MICYGQKPTTYLTNFKGNKEEKNKVKKEGQEVEEGGMPEEEHEKEGGVRKSG